MSQNEDAREQKRREQKRREHEHKVLNQIASLIKVRLPSGHGFALLTFPLGECVDPRTRYVGNGHKDDVLMLMDHWVQSQRGNVATTAGQFSTEPPKVPGIYILKSSHDQLPELVKLEPADGDLQLYHHDRGQWEISQDFVDHLCPTSHIWLGPIPEPWLNPDAPQPQAKADPNEKDLAAWHAPEFDGIVDDYLKELDARSTTPGEPIPEAFVQVVREAVGVGFARGIVAQMRNPFPEKA